MEPGLVGQAQRGDSDALSAVVSGCADRLYAIAFRILRDADLANDALQQDVCRIGKWQHSATCNFTLAHTATDEDAFVFTVESAREMQCGWGGPELGSTFRVEAAPDGTLELRNSRNMPPRDAQSGQQRLTRRE